MNPWIAHLTTLAGGHLLAQLEAPEGTFGASATELMFASQDGLRRLKLTSITRIARSSGAVIISGRDGELLRVLINVPNNDLLAFFQAVKTIANQARLLEHDQGTRRSAPEGSTPTPKSPPSSQASVSPPESRDAEASGKSTVVLEPARSSSFRPEPARPESARPESARPESARSAPPKPGPLKPAPPSRSSAPTDLKASSIFWPAPHIGDEAVHNSLDHLRMMANDDAPHEPAQWNKRLIAAALDAGLFLFAQILVSRLLGLWPATFLDLLSIGSHRVLNPSTYWEAIIDMASVIGFTVVLSWPYFALFEASALQGTPGKLAMRLNVTDLNGRRADFGRTTWRHLARLVPILCGFALWFGGTAFALALDEAVGRNLGLVALVLFTILGMAFPVVAYLRARKDAFHQTLYDQIAGCVVLGLDPVEAAAGARARGG